MAGRVEALRQKLERLLKETAEAAVALDWAEGRIQGVPHYSVIEAGAHQVGRQLSCRIQARQMSELAAQESSHSKCPTCGTRCELTASSRSRSWSATAPAVAGLFFPLREVLGLDARQLTPMLVQRIVCSVADTRSFQRAALVMRRVAGEVVSAKTIERVVHDIGPELASRRDADPKTCDALAERPAEPPDLAVVECDGGRIRTRESGHGPGVHLSGESGWRETKNACLIRASRKTFREDPQPEPPECFSDPKHVAKIAETEALSVAAPLPSDAPLSDEEEGEEVMAKPEDWRPKRLVRTIVSSMAQPKIFGRQMQREAKRRRFFEAASQAFLGDGLPWNWSIWKQQFSEFTPILDFIHVLSYLFLLAKSPHAQADDAWSQYFVWMRGCWQGEVDQVLEELKKWQDKLGEPPPEAAENDPRKLLAKTVTYLDHNRSRMNYPQYRKQGMPVTTAWMESLVKEINYRVKGTEMYWNDPQGAEAILQIRGAALSDDQRLERHLRTRPGCPFTRRPQLTNLPTKPIKS